jgi:SAM-dependent methyltransferase
MTLQKADFGAIYDQPDPRAYFSTLEQYDYIIPELGADVFATLLRIRAAEDNHRPKVLDVCCSYGVVATLLKTDLDIGDLYAHYRSAATRSLSSEQLAAADQRLLLEHHRPGGPHVVGLDVARNAVDYAVATGALDAGIVENLELDEPSAQLIAQLSDVDLITTTGGVGYVTHRTFDRLLEVTSGSVWVAAFCLRTYDYEPIAQTLRRHGLRTERVTRTFPQRRFTGPQEQQWAVSQVRSRGVDPTGKESDGFYHAELYLSRPSREADARPLDQLLPGFS